MKPHSVAAQLRTTDLARSIRFYTDIIGLDLVFEYGDFYAGLSANGQMIHLKRVDSQTVPSPKLRRVNICISISAAMM